MRMRIRIPDASRPYGSKTCDSALFLLLFSFFSFENTSSYVTCICSPVVMYRLPAAQCRRLTGRGRGSRNPLFPFLFSYHPLWDSAAFWRGEHWILGVTTKTGWIYRLLKGRHHYRHHSSWHSGGTTGRRAILGMPALANVVSFGCLSFFSFSFSSLATDVLHFWRHTRDGWIGEASQGICRRGGWSDGYPSRNKI
ncbi:hypothetical protein B0T22DRAFT_50082 [Podospora appendiculata]|uniref:Uncharacterized protein n=1 Tax=Podospora appendiculata TaxID=314037 RepID=A0AAE0XI81_9PEZI|nr:hypothetical protein B0T22DRAFT_50082 [Podospora appendiculata]